MPDQEMLREIKRVLELTSRVDERVKVIAESHERMTDRFDKFMEQHNLLAERVYKLELESVNEEELNERLDDMTDRNNAVENKVVSLEGQAPYALKIVEQSLEALNKLADRVAVVEKNQESNTAKINNWQGWMSWGFEWTVKVAMIVFAYVLAKLGLDKIAIPAPF